MTSLQVHKLLSGGSFYESPRWRDGSWYVSDIYARRVLRVGADGSEHEVYVPPEGRPSGLGWFPNGDLAVVINNKRRIVRVTPSGGVTVHVDLSVQLETHGNFNDMLMDLNGRAYVGNLGAGNFDTQRVDVPAPTCLTVIEPDGSSFEAGKDMYKPNGMVMTTDGRTLIVGETEAQRYVAFELADTGEVTFDRVWADLASQHIHPDGCCLDEAGAVWVASTVGRAGWIRIREGGEILDEIPAPDGARGTACMLGGTDGRTLLMCGRFTPPAGVHAADVRNSFLLYANVDVPRAGLP